MKSLSEYIGDALIEEGAADEMYVVYLEGGSIGDSKHCNARVGSKHVNVYKMNLTKEEAMKERKDYNKLLSPGEKKYYRMKYCIAPESKVKWDSEEKREELLKKQEERNNY
ncbi:MAG: hypothetical protein J1F35_06650 [Erysipelotrichales bacterium]|nr:hypothetical protein [Erysipelotrichales bacterium]